MTPEAPTPPSSSRRALRWLVPTLFAAILALFVASDLARDVARGLGQWAAGVGSLEWRSAAGWVAVPSAAARRRAWGPEHAFLAPPWAEAAPGLELADLAFRRPPNPLEVDVLLVRVDPSRWRFRVWGRPDFGPRPVAALAEAAGLALAVNASYFSDDGPLGLVVSDGATRGRQGTNRAAHFVVPEGGRPRIVNEKRAVLGRLEQGFQGFPSIMTAGRTFSYMRYGGRGFDVWRVDRRSAGCILADGRVVLLVTDTVTNGLSLDELATVLGGVGCVDAMGFDGGSSTGLAIKVGAVERVVANLEPVPVVVGVEPREAVAGE